MLLLHPRPVTALPAAGPVPLEAILVELGARSEGTDHHAAGPDGLVEELVEAVVRNGDLELAVRQLRQVGIVLHQLGALDQVLVDLQLLGQVIDHVLLAGVRGELAHLHPAPVVADHLQSVGVTIVSYHNEVVLLRMLLPVQSATQAAATHAGGRGAQCLKRLVAKLEVLLVHTALDLVDPVAHLIDLFLDGVQLGREGSWRLVFALVAVKGYHRVLLDRLEDRVVDVDARAVVPSPAVLAAAPDARGLLGGDRFFALWAVIVVGHGDFGWLIGWLSGWLVGW